MQREITEKQPLLNEKVLGKFIINGDKKDQI